jgi:hypothetical protein
MSTDPINSEPNHEEDPINSEPNHEEAGPQKPSYTSDKTEDLLFELGECRNVYKLLNDIVAQNIPQEDRKHFYKQFVSLIAKLDAWEREAVIKAGKDVFKYTSTKTVMADVMKETSTGAEIRVRPMVVGEDFVAEVVYQPESVPVIKFLRHSDDGTVSVVESIDIGNVKYMPPQTKLVEKGILMLPTGVEEYCNADAPYVVALDSTITPPSSDTMQLLKKIFAFIDRYLYLEKENGGDNPFKNFCAYYVLLTWMYDKFDVVPYLRAQGNFGTGKTRLLQVVGALSFRSLIASGATTASPIFRIIERFHGTVILDEADFSDRSEIWAEITKILNTGYQRGGVVLRSEKKQAGDQYEPEAFDCYSPKILSTRQQYSDEALESRCLTHTMPVGHMVPGEIPLVLGDDFRKEAQQLRNMLLFWRLRHWRTVTLDPCERFYYDREKGTARRFRGDQPIDNEQKKMLKQLDNRLNQLLLPLLAVCDDEKLSDAILKHAYHFQRRVGEERRDSIEGRIMQCALEAYDRRDVAESHRCEVLDCYKSQSHWIHDIRNPDRHIYRRIDVVSLSQIASRVAQEFEGERLDKLKLGSHALGHRFRGTFGLKTCQNSNRVTYVMFPPEKVEQFRERFSILESKVTTVQEEKAAALSTTNGTVVIRQPVMKQSVVRQPVIKVKG